VKFPLIWKRVFVAYLERGTGDGDGDEYEDDEDDGKSMRTALS